MEKNYWYLIGGIAVGAIGATIVYKNKQKIKPLAAELVAKAMHLKDKAVEAAERTKEHAEDIVAEARHINETTAE